jgi:hypothetical protein
MADITLIPSAKVPLVYPEESTMTTEWYRFFWNIYGFTGTGVVPVSKGGTGLNTIGNHQLIIGNANNVFEPALLSSASIAITYPAGFINLELGTSGVTSGTYGSASTVGVFTVNAYGVLTAASNASIGIDASQIISGTLPVIRGGTGQSTYTDGQLLIGNTTGNTLTKATLTAGTGISVTNGAGSITIANTGVLSVSGTAPVVSSGGATPAISMAAANTTTNGYLTSTDWNTFNNKAPATSGTSILYGNGTGGFSNVTIGSGISFAGGTLSATGSGGTVTSVTGTSPVVSSGGTTPAISLATAYGDTLNPYASKTANYFLAAPNGSAGVPTFRAMVAADVPALAYVTSVSGTGSVNGITLTGTVISSGSLTLGGTLSGIGNSQLTNSTISGVALGGNLFNLTAGTGVSFSAGTTYNGSAAITINATGTGGTVTSVAALTLGTTGTDLSSTVANGTTTPVITLNVPTASAANRGALSSTDWSTFNSKQAALVSGTNIKTVGGVSLLGSGDVGTIGATYGGTGQSSYAVGDILYASTTTALSKLADVATGNALISGGVGVAPSYGKIGLTTHISGTLPIANGGTNTTTQTASGMAWFDGTKIRTDASVYWDSTYMGIGTTSGFGVLNVNSTGGSQSCITIGDIATPANAVGIYMRANGSGACGISTAGAALAFYQGGPGAAEAMRIHAGGGVSIGNTTDPGATNLSVTGSVVTSQTAGIIGTTTNNDANAGSIGEYIIASVAIGSAVSLTTNVSATITSISLTAGDWDVWGMIGLNQPAATVVSYVSFGAGTSSSAVPAGNNAAVLYPPNGTAITPQTPIIQRRLSLSTTTTVYLNLQAGFTTSTLVAFGFVAARRRR